MEEKSISSTFIVQLVKCQLYVWCLFLKFVLYRRVGDYKFWSHGAFSRLSFFVSVWSLPAELKEALFQGILHENCLSDQNLFVYFNKKKLSISGIFIFLFGSDLSSKIIVLYFPGIVCLISFRLHLPFILLYNLC